MHGKFATVINFMDVNVQDLVIKYIRDKYSVDYVDIITEIEPNKIFTENKNSIIEDSIRERLEISINKHKSICVAITVNFSTENQVLYNEQTEGIKNSIEHIKKWYDNIEIIGLYIDENFVVNEII